MNVPVFDLHCDTAFVLATDRSADMPSLRNNSYCIDLNRAKKLPGYVQCFACFTSALLNIPEYNSIEQLFEKEKATILDQIAINSDLIRLAGSKNDILKNHQNGFMSAILTIENPAGFSCDPGRLEDLYKTGFRISNLGWNDANLLAGSHITGGGLTELGRAYVREIQRLGMLIDVSHSSDDAFWNVIAITQGPVIASHSNSRAVRNVSRNLTDDMFRAICETGGLVGMNLYTDFLGPEATLDTVADHVLHFLDLDPQGKHIALGGDLDGCDSLPEGFSNVADYSKLADTLLHRGLSDTMIYDIFWNNAMGVMERCCM